MDDDLKLTGATSRRDALKKIGAGSALIWSAPALTSLGAAYAQSGESPALGECRDCDPADPCFGQTPCGGGSCSCVPRVDGGCFCHQPTSCAGQVECTDQNDCPSGTVCSHSCCDLFGFPTLCLPVCVSDAGAAAPVDGEPWSAPLE